MIPLSPREKQLVRMLAEDRTSKEISYLLEINYRTVSSLLGTAKLKAQVRTIHGLVLALERSGDLRA